MAYKPNPIATRDIQLPKELLDLLEELARNVHEEWAKARIEDGWKYGVKRCDKKKEHPCLIPYEELSEKEKRYDRITTLTTLKAIQKLGYTIKKE